LTKAKEGRWCTRCQNGYLIYCRAAGFETSVCICICTAAIWSLPVPNLIRALRYSRQICSFSSDLFSIVGLDCLVEAEMERELIV
jgi:hypothetical protein